jgi:hypothetical protein
MARKPTARDKQPERHDTYRTRWLDPNPAAADFSTRFAGIQYRCYGKHKRNPYLYCVSPYHGTDVDRSLCDEHAGFVKSDMIRIPLLLRRAELAGLAGNLIWTVDDTGWIYELMSTNVGLNEWHGYPLLLRDPFARQVWERFFEWANQYGDRRDRDAAECCAQFYGFRR